LIFPARCLSNYKKLMTTPQMDTDSLLRAIKTGDFLVNLQNGQSYCIEEAGKDFVILSEGEKKKLSVLYFSTLSAEQWQLRKNV
jgi:hypothetical protein